MSIPEMLPASLTPIATRTTFKFITNVSNHSHLYLPSKGINVFMTQQKIYFQMTEITISCAHEDIHLLRDCFLLVNGLKFYGHCICDIDIDTTHKHINSEMPTHMGSVHAHMCVCSW